MSEISFYLQTNDQKKNSKKKIWQKFEAEAMKKTCIGIAKEIFVGLDGFVNGRLM